eukprot:TRINITY_DN8261_c0_g1_i1.p1 TRINITY_DN8261_c0_g1~~TRINITY_DN8261_c0_g1_i1.p1  ORF type:complete len:133 (-),score=4.02 TRINITY_DN8261_c0_g1_i1:4-402(-)
MSEHIHYDKTFEGIVYSNKETKNREFDQCAFINCDFSNGMFTSSTFTRCTFTGCNLTSTKLVDCKLDKITFKGCKLLGVNFSEANDLLFSVNFEECILDYCSFNRKKIRNTPFRDCSIKEVDFSDSDPRTLR